MPTVLRSGPYRFFFYAGDREEHVEREDKVVKFWLVPVRLQESGGFPRAELNRIRQLVELNQDRFLEAWHEYFGA